MARSYEGNTIFVPKVLFRKITKVSSQSGSGAWGGDGNS